MQWFSHLYPLSVTIVPLPKEKRVQITRNPIVQMEQTRESFEKEFTSEKYLTFDTSKYDFVGVIKKIFDDADLQQLHQVNRL
jgi:hypothetical protein